MNSTERRREEERQLRYVQACVELWLTGKRVVEKVAVPSATFKQCGTDE